MITAHFPCQTWSLHPGGHRKRHTQCWGSALEPRSCVMGGDVTPKTHSQSLWHALPEGHLLLRFLWPFVRTRPKLERNDQNKTKPKAAWDPVACESKSNKQSLGWASNTCPLLGYIVADGGKTDIFQWLHSVRHYTGCWLVVSCHLFSIFVRQVLVSPFYRWGNEGSEGGFINFSNAALTL